MPEKSPPSEAGPLILPAALGARDAALRSEADLTSTDAATMRDTLTASFPAFVAFFQPHAFLSDFHVNDLAPWMQAHSAQSYFDPCRMLVMMPRTHRKTRLANALYLLWLYCRDHEITTLQASNTANNAEKQQSIILNYFENNPLFRAVFHECIPPTFQRDWSRARAVAPRSINVGEGTFNSCGVGADMTGSHFRVIAEDDTVSPKRDDLTGEEYIPSRSDIEKAIGWHRLIEPFMMPPGRGTNLVIGTRWAVDDLLGFVTKELGPDGDPLYDQYIVACVKDVPQDSRPLITKWREGTPIDKLHPLEVLERLKAKLGDYFFSALYLNDPQPESSRLFRRESIKYHKIHNPTHVGKDAYVCLTVDPAVSTKDSADYSALCCCAHTRGRLDVVAVDRGRWRPDELVDRALVMARAWDATELRMETISMAQTFIPIMREEIDRRGMRLVFTPVKQVRGTKGERICALQPLFEAGEVYLSPDMPALETEMLEFTVDRTGRHDDLLDALSLQVPVYRRAVRSPAATPDRPRGITKADILRGEHRANEYQPIYQ